MRTKAALDSFAEAAEGRRDLINTVQSDRHVRRWRVQPGGGAAVGAFVGEVAQRANSDSTQFSQEP